jgi:hypothetical protein
MGLVALTRAREQTRLYTTANEFEPDASPHRSEPAEPVDRLADALTRSATETLALDTATAPSEPAERAALAQQSRQLRERRLALEKERLETRRELHRTTRMLAGTGLVGRARHGGALRHQLDEHKQKLALLDHEVDRLDGQIRETRERTLEHAPSLPEQRQHRERALRRTLERGLDPWDRAVSYLSMPMPREIPSVRSIPTSTSMIRRSSRDCSTASRRSRSASRPGSWPSS